MTAKLLLFVGSLFCCFNLFAVAAPGKLNISIDFESARLISALMAKNKVTDAELEKVVNAFGSRQLIEKVKGYSGADVNVFKSTLREIIETGTLRGSDPYNWKEVKANLKAINQLLHKLSVSPDAFINDIKLKITDYTSDIINADIKACFIIGGGSLGFTQGDGMTFNVALQKIGDDVEGLKLLVAHELYHSIQVAGQASRNIRKTAIPYHVKATYALLYSLWSEGTASLVGDFSGMRFPAAFSKSQLDEYEKNAVRKRENFALFEALVYKCFTDSASRSYGSFYNIGFSTAFDETSYYVGYEMSKKITQYLSKQAIADGLTQDLLAFAETYIKLYKNHPEDKTFIRFDIATENIDQQLVVWRDKV
ncbi:DUF5700 domain-containing putative Zn-dependent protease [Mucilaginibacter terrae]|uniref:DUF2268 domain-containing protein n=1 Tax=Mucilaginibacter terrae TaxID=1955052 RepID=A0ABU3GNW9_9SPHI|nr:DUF5700 domain-containing putative Zn-dependent protease [Mucilaginibacter terrae]MDT3401216.1 hypothetical protein [Mucilaginibacter terrae]